jgi:hypothetical protein
MMPVGVGVDGGVSSKLLVVALYRSWMKQERQNAKCKIPPMLF